MSSNTKNGSFDDLEEMDHKDIDEMKGDLARELRSVERQHRELRDEPVSYTHLTLPTICSV